MLIIYAAKNGKPNTQKFTVLQVTVL